MTLHEAVRWGRVRREECREGPGVKAPGGEGTVTVGGEAGAEPARGRRGGEGTEGEKADCRPVTALEVSRGGRVGREHGRGWEALVSEARSQPPAGRRSPTLGTRAPPAQCPTRALTLTGRQGRSRHV